MLSLLSSDFLPFSATTRCGIIDKATFPETKATQTYEMPLRDLLKKKDKYEVDTGHSESSNLPPPPEFTFMRTDTHTQEILSLPEEPPSPLYDTPTDGSGDVYRSRLSRLTGRSRSHSNASTASRSSDVSKSKDRPSNDRRLSQRLGFRKPEPTSTAVPQNLPEIRDGQDEDGDAWEQRATILARENERNRSAPATPVREDMPDLGALGLGKGNEGGIVSSKNTDDNIQEAIRLHEAGELVKATRMFGRLADPNGENNALSQVLYGLALR